MVNRLFDSTCSPQRFSPLWRHDRWCSSTLQKQNAILWVGNLGRHVQTTTLFLTNLLHLGWLNPCTQWGIAHMPSRRCISRCNQGVASVSPVSLLEPANVATDTVPLFQLAATVGISPQAASDAPSTAIRSPLHKLRWSLPPVIKVVEVHWAVCMITGVAG